MSSDRETKPGAQPARTADTGEDSESLASSIAQRKTGDPSAYQRASGDKFEEGKNAGARGAGDKHPFEKLKWPVIWSGLAIALVGAVIALASKGKGHDDSYVVDGVSERRPRADY